MWRRVIRGNSSDMIAITKNKTKHPKKRASQTRFLAALVGTGGNIVGAARAAGIDRNLHYF